MEHADIVVEGGQVDRVVGLEVVRAEMAEGAARFTA